MLNSIRKQSKGKKTISYETGSKFKNRPLTAVPSSHKYRMNKQQNVMSSHKNLQDKNVVLNSRTSTQQRKLQQESLSSTEHNESVSLLINTQGKAPSLHSGRPESLVGHQFNKPSLQVSDYQQMPVEQMPVEQMPVEQVPVE